jgi:3-oxoadipate enol-lactonase
MAFDEAGAGPAVVLLHGFPFNRSMWRQQIEVLRANFRVITPDLRGHGESGLVSEPATMEEMARDVAALLDELRIDHATLGGLSMGGYVTLAFYRLFPERVSALVLADTRAQADSEDGKRAREENAQRALQQGMEPIADAMLPKLLSSNTLSQRPDLSASVRAMILGTRPEGAAAALRGMALRRDQTDLLPSISVPTLVLVGTEDNLTPVEDARLIRDRVRGSRLALIDGAAHLSNLERPDEFNSSLVEFLNDYKDGGEQNA